MCDIVSNYDFHIQTHWNIKQLTQQVAARNIYNNFGLFQHSNQLTPVSQIQLWLKFGMHQVL